MPSDTELPVLTAKDFASDQDVRWCPGCGDYAILNQVRKVMVKLGNRREKTVFVSGIGCSSRFPYYMNTYGFHSIHGRAPAIATGVKIANPKLDVWMVTGDGDGLSIGGNHLVHILRRNVNTILLFNNRIYGLTKGQYSPTSEEGKKTKSSPMGSIELPICPLSLALAAEASFVARTIDVDKDLSAVLDRAAKHKGSAFVEIYQDCNIFNHKAFEYATDKDTKEDHILRLEHGKPLIFGKGRDKGIRLHDHKPEIVKLAAQGPASGLLEDDLLFRSTPGRREPGVPPLTHEPPGVPRARRRVLHRRGQLLRGAARQAGPRTRPRPRASATSKPLFNAGETYSVGA